MYVRRQSQTKNKLIFLFQLCLCWRSLTRSLQPMWTLQRCGGRTSEFRTKTFLSVYFFCKNQFTFQGPVQETCLCKREKEPGHGLIFALQPLTLMLTLTQLCNCELYTCTPTKLAPLNFSHSRTDAEKVQCDDHFQFSLYDESAFFATSHHCRACTRSSSCLSLWGGRSSRSSALTR